MSGWLFERSSFICFFFPSHSCRLKEILLAFVLLSVFRILPELAVALISCEMTQLLAEVMCKTLE